MGEPGVAMLELLGAEGLDSTLQLAFALGQRLALARVMLVDPLFNGDGAGHGRLGPEKRRRRAEGKAGGMPERLQRRRPDPSIAQHAVEGREMAPLLLRHMQ